MPTYAPQKLCPVHRTLHSDDRCPRCVSIYEARRGNSHRRGYDSRWVKVRNFVLQRDGYQCFCGGTEPGCDGIATEVHHVKPIAQGGARLDPDNCISGAHSCHMKAEAAARKGVVLSKILEAFEQLRARGLVR
jgi:HNH endonuclease.